MIITTQIELIRQIHKAKSDSNRLLLGTKGYQLPELDRLARSEITPEQGCVIYKNRNFNDFSIDMIPSSMNNTIIFDQECSCYCNIIIRGSGNIIIVRGSKEGHNPINIHMFSDRGLFFFGEYSTSNTATFEISGDEKSIIIGEDCMFSAFIDVETDDMHGIFEFDTGRHLNPPESILLSPHVWVGLHVTILKGVNIGFGSIVAARSVVSRSMPEMVVIGGVPGTIIKRGVTWTRAKNPTQQEQDQVRELYAIQKIRR